MAVGRILGRYRIVAPLGRGGMGSVWRAEHIELGTPAAVKLLASDIARSPEMLARFKREAQAAAALRSVHVVQIFDYDVQDGTPYIVMELLEGESLAQRLARVGPLSPRETLEILEQVGKALARAHERGIVHRDLKPDNVFLAREGSDEIAKVLDFGIAKATTLAGSSGGATQTGTLLGTPCYMSPEQAWGKRAVDHRTDLWALGVMAFECLTGKVPFQGETLTAVVLAICVEPILRPSQVSAVPAGFDEWFARALERDPDRRFQSVGEAIAGLRAVVERYPMEAGAHQVERTVAVPGLGPEPEIQKLGTFGEAMQQTAAPASVTVAKTRRERLVPWLVAIGAGVIAVGGGWSLLRLMRGGGRAVELATTGAESAGASASVAREIGPAEPTASIHAIGDASGQEKPLASEAILQPVPAGSDATTPAPGQSSVGPGRVPARAGEGDGRLSEAGVRAPGRVAGGPRQPATPSAAGRTQPRPEDRLGF